MAYKSVINITKDKKKREEVHKKYQNSKNTYNSTAGAQGQAYTPKKKVTPKPSYTPNVPSVTDKKGYLNKKKYTNKSNGTNNKQTETKRTSYSDDSVVNKYGSRSLTAKKNGEVKVDRRAEIASKHKGQVWSSRTGGYVDRPQKTNMSKSEALGQTTQKSSRKSLGGIDYNRANAAKERAGSQNITELRDKGYETYRQQQEQRKKDQAGLTQGEYMGVVQKFINNRAINTPDEYFGTTGAAAGYVNMKIKETDRKIEELSLSITKSDDPVAVNKELNELRSYRDRLTATKNDLKNQSRYTLNVEKREWEYDRDPKAEAWANAGKKNETFISDVDEGMAMRLLSQSYALGTNEDATLKAASYFMTDRERKVYFATKAKEGEQGAKDYLRELYDKGELGQRVTDFISNNIDKNEKANPVAKGIVKYGGSFTAGVGNAFEGIQDAAIYGAGAKDYVHAENIGKKMYAKRKQENPNDIGIDIAFNTGNMMPAIAVSVATGGVGSSAVVSAIASSSLVGVSSFGNTYQEARRQGYTSDEAAAYALADGISEAALQYALNGVAAVAGGSVTGAMANRLSNIAKGAISRLVTYEPAQALLNKIIMASVGAMGEFEEEYLQAVLDPIFRNAFLGELTNVEPLSEDTLYQGLLGALTAFGMNTGTIAIDTAAENSRGKEAKTTQENGKSKVQEAYESEFYKNLPDDTEVKRLGNKVLAGGIENAHDGSVGRFMNEFDKAQESDTDIMAFVRNLLGWNNVSDEGRRMLVDPSKAEYIKSRYGIDVNENMTPQEMKRAVMEARTKWYDDAVNAQDEVLEYLRGELSKNELSDPAKRLLADDMYRNALIENKTDSLTNLSRDSRSAALDRAVENITDLTEEQRARYEEVKARLLNQDIPYGKDVSEVSELNEIEDIIREQTGKRRSKKLRGTLLEALLGQSEPVQETQAETQTEQAETQAETKATPSQSSLGNEVTKETGMPRRGKGTTPSAFAINPDLDYDDPAAIQGRIEELLNKEDLTEEEADEHDFLMDSYRDEYENAYRNVYGDEAYEQMIQKAAKSMTPAQTKNQGGQYATDEEAVLAQTLTEFKPKKQTREQRAARRRALREQIEYHASNAQSSFDGANRKVKGNNRILYATDAVRSATNRALHSLGLSLFGGKRAGFQTDINGKNVGKSLRSIFEPLYKLKNPELTQKVFGYLLCRDHVDRITDTTDAKPKLRNKSGEYMTQAEAEAQAQKFLDDIAKADPKLAEMVEYSYIDSNGNTVTETVPRIAAEVWGYGRNLLQKRYDAGLISAEAFDRISGRHPHYVPSIPATETEQATAPTTADKADVSRSIKRDTGADLNVAYQPIDEALATQTINIEMNARKNMLLKTLAEEAQADPEALKEYVLGLEPEATVDLEGRKMSKKQMAKYKEAGIIGEIEQFFSDEMMLIKDADRKAGTVSFLDGGKRVTMRVSDGIIKGFNAFNGEVSGIEKVMGKINGVYRSLITNYNPFFTARNALRDLDAFFFSKHTKLFTKHFFKTAYPQMAKNGELWQFFEAVGGFSGSLFESASQGKNKGIKANRNLLARWTIDKIEMVNLVIEQAPRFAEFCATLEANGVIDSKGNFTNNITDQNKLTDIINEALYDAHEVTVNFARGGRTVKRMNNAGFTFLNASIQGASKYARFFAEQRGKAWLNVAAKAAIMGIAPQIINSLIYKDDKDYENLDDYYKDNFLCVKNADGTWTTLAYPRFMSVIRAATRRILDASQGKEVDWGSFMDTVNNNIAPANPITSNIFYPAFRNLVLNETWWGSKIDDEYDLKHPEEAYSQKTSSWIVGLGQAIGVSPQRLQDLFESYGGIVADYVVPLTSPEGQAKYTNPLEKGLAPFLQSFTKDNRYDYYSVQDEFKAYQDAVKDRQTEESKEYDSELMTPSDYVSSILNKKNQLASEQYEEIRRIYFDDSIPPEEKQDLVNAAKLNLSVIYAEGVAEAEKFEELLDKYWKVDTDQPIEIQKRQANLANYKATKDLYGAREALKKMGITDDSMAKMVADGIDLNDYYDYYIQTRSGNKYMSLDEEGLPGKLDDADKKQILLGTKVSDDQFAKIYAKEFEDKRTKEENSILAAQKNGVSPQLFTKTSMALSDIEKENEGKPKTEDSIPVTTQKKQWIIDNISDDKSLTHLYGVFCEDSDTKEQNTIAYAVEHGVDPKRFVKESIAASTTEGIKSGEQTRTPYIEDGVVKYDVKDKYISGSKLYNSTTRILNSGYTETEMGAFYDREFDDPKFQWIQTAGMPTKKYIEFRNATAMVTADKDKDGNSINGTKRPKIEAIIKGLGMSSIERELALVQMGYKLEKSEYTELANHILGLSKPLETRTATLEGLGYKIEDGRVYPPK